MNTLIYFEPLEHPTFLVIFSLVFFLPSIISFSLIFSIVGGRYGRKRLPKKGLKDKWSELVLASWIDFQDQSLWTPSFLFTTPKNDLII